MTHKRLSLNRDKLKQYCGQLDLERIPEDPVGTYQSPRDQKQVLLNSYRTHRYDFQLQLSKPKERKAGRVSPQHTGDTLSSMTLGSMVGSVDPAVAINQYRKARAMVPVSMSGEGTLAQRREEANNADYTYRSRLN